jgi:hypothetical protein
MSYHIEINEYQRRLIMKALTSTDVNQFSQAPGSGDAFDTEAKEFVFLVQMFGTLDLDVPNVIRHGYARMSAEGDRTAWLSEMWWQNIPLKGRTDFQGSSRILATETIRV